MKTCIFSATLPVLLSEPSNNSMIVQNPPSEKEELLRLLMTKRQDDFTSKRSFRYCIKSFVILLSKV